MSNQYDLSDRELEILELLALGASNKEIATRLVISTNTVKVHLRNIYAKLGVNSRTEAAMLALRENMIDVEGIATLDSDSIAREIRNRSITIPGIGVWVERSKGIWIMTVLVAVMFLVAIISMFFLIREGSRGQPEERNTDRWERKADLPTPRSGLALVVYANQIYTIGGESPIGVTGIMERYDPALDEWATLETKPLPVADVKAAVIGERIYVPGGRLDSGEPTDVVEVYDPILSEWSKVRSLPIKISGYALVAFEGKLYVFGGWNGESYLSNVFSYDPKEDQWVERAPMLTSRGFSGAATAGGVIYVIGGFNGEISLDVNEAYYPSRDIEGGVPWQEFAPLPMAGHGMGIAGLADILYVFGGTLDAQDKNLVLQYLPQSDGWQVFGDSPIKEEWQQPGLVPYEGYLFIMGGRIGPRISSNNFAYQAIFNILFPVLSK